MNEAIANEMEMTSDMTHNGVVITESNEALPEGVRLPPQPGCDGTGREPERKAGGATVHPQREAVAEIPEAVVAGEFGVRR